MTQENEKRCGNCGHSMEFIRREDIQLGKASILGGTWPNIWAGALDVELWGCPNCRKLDFYWGGGENDTDWDGGDHMAQTTCPRPPAPPAVLSTTWTTRNAPGAGQKIRIFEEEVCYGLF